MLRNYLKIAWRTLLVNRTFSMINILGLAIGLSSCMLISLFVLDELSFDRYNEHADRIVRVVFKGNMQGGKINEAHVMPPVAQTLKADYPEVIEATRLRQVGSPTVIIDNKQYTGDQIAFADANFFHVFSLPFDEGDASTALKETNSLVISTSVANKYFGKQNPIGKTLRFKDDNTPYKVTGVMNEIPENSHFHFDIFASMTGFEDAKSASWMISEFFTYLLLPKGYDYKLLEAKLPRTVDKYMGPQLKQAMGVSMSEFKKGGNDLGLYLQPLTAIHLHSDFLYDLGNNGDILYVYIFAVLAVIMLVLACINFMNLSTASASKRAREVGIRKVMGSQRRELIGQFLLESILLTFIALLLAAIFCYFALPLFNHLSGKNLTSQLQSIPSLLPGLLLFGLIVGILAGSYPAFSLSSFKPALVLKGKTTSNTKGLSLRSGLVVVQFFISITLIIGTTVVYQQLQFIQNKKLGYNKDQVLILPDMWALGKDRNVFRDELIRDPRIVSISSSGYLPAGPSFNNNFMVYPDGETDNLVHTLRYDVDFNYIPTLGMEMATGRNFSKNFGDDSSGVIMNETAMSMMGWKLNDIDHTLTNTNNNGDKRTYHVIGIVKDFHFRSLHERITPLVMVLNANTGAAMIMKIKTKDVKELLATVKNHWDELSPQMPFSYSFLDERFNNTYRSEQRTGEILGIFAGLTIFVACLGLFGLATFTAHQRSKEIGIRKVLGASIGSIVNLLSKAFLQLVLLAFVIAAPVAWFMMTEWLQDFEYRISLTWWIFAFSGLLAVIIATLTVSYQSLKTALINPVDSIRME